MGRDGEPFSQRARLMCIGRTGCWSWAGPVGISDVVADDADTSSGEQAGAAEPRFDGRPGVGHFFTADGESFADGRAPT